jgi:hypothetical protein
MPRQAVIGPEIVARVNALLAEGESSRTAAFQKVAQERGMQAGTVAANYYRIMRRENPQALKSRKRRKATARPAKATRATQSRPTPVRAPVGSGDLDRLANAVSDSLSAFIAEVKKQQAQTNELRSKLQTLLG